MKKVNKELLKTLNISPAMYESYPVFEYKKNGKSHTGSMRTAILKDLDEVKSLDFSKYAIMEDWEEPEGMSSHGEYKIRYCEI
jgi:hypothetical protein